MNNNVASAFVRAFKTLIPSLWRTKSRLLINCIIPLTAALVLLFVGGRSIRMSFTVTIIMLLANFALTFFGALYVLIFFSTMLDVSYRRASPWWYFSVIKQIPQMIIFLVIVIALAVFILFVLPVFAFTSLVLIEFLLTSTDTPPLTSTGFLWFRWVLVLAFTYLLTEFIYTPWLMVDKKIGFSEALYRSKKMATFDVRVLSFMFPLLIIPLREFMDGMWSFAFAGTLFAALICICFFILTYMTVRFQGAKALLWTQTVEKNNL